MCPLRVLHTYIDHTQNVQCVTCLANPARGRALSKQRLTLLLDYRSSFVYSTKGLALPQDVRMATSVSSLWEVYICPILYVMYHIVNQL